MPVTLTEEKELTREEIFENITHSGIKFDREIDDYIPKVIDLPYEYKSVKDLPTTGKDEIPVFRDDLENYVEMENSSRARWYRIRYDKLFPDNPLFQNKDGNLEYIEMQKINLQAFISNTSATVNDLNYILNVYPEFALSIAAIKQNIYYTDRYTNNPTLFANDIVDFALDHRLRDIVHTIDESTYELELDENIRKNRESGNNRMISDFQISDGLNKILIETAMIYRIVTSFMSEYLNTTKLNIRQKNNFVTDINEEIIYNISEPQGIKIKNKLYRIVNPRVTNTSYSDKTIWHYLANMGVDPSTISYEIYRSLINSIISKLRNNYSSISLLHVCIRGKIKYTFKAKFPVKYSPLSVPVDSGDDDDDDKLDRQFQHDGNEIEQIINQLAIHDYLAEHKDEIDTEDFKMFNNWVAKPNVFQDMILEIKMSDKFNLKYASREEKMMMIYLIAKETITEKNFDIIPKLLLSKHIANPAKDNQRFAAMYTPTNYVSNSGGYQRVIEDFHWMTSIISNKNPFVSVSSLSRYTFQDYKGNILTDFDKNESIEEFCRFCKR